MNPQVRHAQRACEAAKARQAVVVFIDGSGQYAVVSYGETKAECSAVKPLCNAIADAIDGGDLPVPAGRNRPPSLRERAWEMRDQTVTASDIRSAVRAGRMLVHAADAQVRSDELAAAGHEDAACLAALNAGMMLGLAVSWLHEIELIDGGR